MNCFNIVLKKNFHQDKLKREKLNGAPKFGSKMQKRKTMIIIKILGKHRIWRLSRWGRGVVR